MSKSVSPCKFTIPTTIQKAAVKHVGRHPFNLSLSDVCHFSQNSLQPWGTLFTWELLKWSRGITPDWLIHLETWIIVFLDMPGLSLVSLGFHSRIPMVGCIIGHSMTQPLHQNLLVKIRQHVEWTRKRLKNRLVPEKNTGPCTLMQFRVLIVDLNLMCF